MEGQLRRYVMRVEVTQASAIRVLSRTASTRSLLAPFIKTTVLQTNLFKAVNTCLTVFFRIINRWFEAKLLSSYSSCFILIFMLID